MLLPWIRQGDRLAITRSLDPTPVVIDWAPRADLHQMPQDLSNLLWIGDIGNQFTITFGRSYIKTVSTSRQMRTCPLLSACKQPLLFINL